MKRLTQILIIALLFSALSLNVNANNLFTELPELSRKSYTTSGIFEPVKQLFSIFLDSVLNDKTKIDLTLNAKYSSRVPDAKQLEETKSILTKRLTMNGFNSINITIEEKTGKLKISAITKSLDDNTEIRKVIENAIKPGKITFEEVSENSMDIAGDYMPAGKIIVENKHIIDASAEPAPDGAGYSVSIRFNDEGSKLFSEATAKLVGKPIGIFLDDKLLTAPVVAQQITGETCRISLGQIETSEQADYARNLAGSIKSGLIPVELSIDEFKIS